MISSRSVTFYLSKHETSDNTTNDYKAQYLIPINIIQYLRKLNHFFVKHNTKICRYFAFTVTVVGFDGMVKYGRGLNREIVGAVNRQIIKEPFSIADVRGFVLQKEWDVTEAYIQVCLANGASSKHSPTYKKYFKNVSDGKYVLKEHFIGEKWI